MPGTKASAVLSIARPRIGYGRLTSCVLSVTSTTSLVSGMLNSGMCTGGDHPWTAARGSFPVTRASPTRTASHRHRHTRRGHAARKIPDSATRMMSDGTPLATFREHLAR